MTREEAVKKYGEAFVFEAESCYETMDDKYFWSDLDDSERSNYFAKVRIFGLSEYTKNKFGIKS